MHATLSGRFRRRTRAALVASFSWLMVAAAVAQELPVFAPALSGPLWPTTGGSPYSLGQVPTPPYFALHPPVYYSVPVPRTYGYSPYAYPASMVTPEVVREPEVIVNPHVESPARMDRPRQASHATQSPLAIDNPFVRAEVRAVSGAASHPARETVERPASGIRTVVRTRP